MWSACGCYCHLTYSSLWVILSMYFTLWSYRICFNFLWEIEKSLPEAICIVFCLLKHEYRFQHLLVLWPGEKIVVCIVMCGTKPFEQYCNWTFSPSSSAILTLQWTCSRSQDFLPELVQRFSAGFDYLYFSNLFYLLLHIYQFCLTLLPGS